jgi:hypothetical protein
MAVTPGMPPRLLRSENRVKAVPVAQIDPRPPQMCSKVKEALAICGDNMEFQKRNMPDEASKPMQRWRRDLDLLSEPG